MKPSFVIPALVIAVSIFLFAGCVQKVASANETDDPGNPTDPAQNVDVPAGEVLMYFWMFGGSVPNNVELTELDATYPAVSDARLQFRSSLSAYPNTNRKGSMERRNAPTPVNYHPAGYNNQEYNAATMRGIQVKQPFHGDSGEHALIFNLPTNGFQAVQFTLAAMDENAAQSLVFDYSVTAGDAVWITTGLQPSSRIQSLTTGEYTLFKLDLANITAVNNNPNFRIRIRFQVADGLTDNGDRVTFNNIALHGDPIS